MKSGTVFGRVWFWLLLVFGIALGQSYLAHLLAQEGGRRCILQFEEGAYSAPPGTEVDLLRQTLEAAQAKSASCVHCHQSTGDPHCKASLNLGCIDCHGGNPQATLKIEAHVASRHPEVWCSSANPVRSYTLLNGESPEFVRFVNPGDLRIAHLSCGTMGCHGEQVLQVKKSMMTHGCMLWGAALYNNGAVPQKRARYGESYSMNGAPQRLMTVPPPTEEEMAKKGVLEFLDPLPRFENSQPGNVLRIFERGGRFRPEGGIPERLDDPGRPKTRLSNRGLGTENRTDPVFLGLQKTRLFDPTLNFLGTNDQPGDYRSSGCTGCHVVYANDRSKVTAGPYHGYGNRGQALNNPDPTIPKHEPGHPIAHRFAPGSGIPTSQCLSCHIHPGTTVMNSYPGFMWWDEESDAELMFPAHARKPSAVEFAEVQARNPNASAARNNLADPEFVANLTDLNGQTKHNQFADFHSHGWAFRAVFKKDRQGHYLDHHGRIIPEVNNAVLQAGMRYQQQDSKERKAVDGLPVHLMDIHAEKGMHCVDCHFIQDSHGNTKLYGEVRAAIEIQCIDCHGTPTQHSTLRTSGPCAEEPKGRNLATLRTGSGQRRFEWVDGKLYQNSMVEPGLKWEVPQTKDVITPGNPRYNQKAHLAKTVRFASTTSNQMIWGTQPGPGETPCAHVFDKMSCVACHSAWNPSCYGCHLPQKANRKTPMLHNEGEMTRNQVEYNFQTLRDDVFMLAKDGDVTGNKFSPARSSCAVHVGSYNNNRESIYVQQQTISAEGMSGIAFSTNVPHTVRGGPPRDAKGRALSADAYLPGRSETKSCTDCHVSQANDNNAIMAQLLMQGTNYLNFIGKYCWVAGGEGGLFGVAVTEKDEPQAVIGSTLHSFAFPEEFRKHQQRGRMLKTAYEHPGKDISDSVLLPLRKAEVLSVQARGEYLYAACGAGGVRVFDIAFIDNKAFSERVTTAPVSPFGQRFFVQTCYAQYVTAPTTVAPDPTRTHRPENKEQAVHPMYGYIYVADRDEGLILIGVATTIDGNSANNFLNREVTFNPNGLLRGARLIAFLGVYAYVCCDAGVAVISLEDPKQPVLKHLITQPNVKHPKMVAFQFRYGFVCDAEGVKVLDVTNPERPELKAAVEMPHANSIYVARTYGYVAAGPAGLVILNVENPEKARIDQVYNASHQINDAHDVKLGITYVSQFAYIADGKNGMRIVQLTSPETPGNEGFSPRPTPCLVATYKLPEGGEAKAISKGLDRDRAVDESGNQLSVFGRIGARPLNRAEQQRMYLRNGQLWKVSDDPAWWGYEVFRAGRKD